jgi:glycosyltransferase involved in cell wall biosynthesis
VSRPRVVLLRGHSANTWDLRPWELLAGRFDVAVVVTRSNEFDVGQLGLERIALRSVRDPLPAGRLGNAAAYALGDRYLGLEDALRGAAIVHSADIHTWFSAQAAALKSRLPFRLALTVWETIPFRDAYRWPRERRYRRAVLPAVDGYLAATERAREALLLEDVPPDRIEVCYPGIDVTRFAGAARDTAPPPLILSPGRLVWEKGHQDVLRALAALHQGLDEDGGRPLSEARALIVGAGPEEARLRRYAGDLGLADRVDFRRGVPYDEMPGVYAGAACMVLASLTTRAWEEQFGMVLAEAMAAGLPIAAARSGAIPEVVGGTATLFAPGDWRGLARVLRRFLEAPALAPSAERAELVRRYSIEAAAERLAAAYGRLAA